MSVPFAPYESVPDDDLGAAAAATVCIGTGGLLAVTLGMQAWGQIPAVRAGLRAEKLAGDNLATVITTFGWGLATVLLGLGGVLMVFRRGRGLLVFGALIATVTTAVARYAFGWFTPTHPVDNMLVFWGGVVVIALAALPAVGRWVAGRRRRGAVPVLTAATPIAPSTNGVVSTLSAPNRGRSR